MERGGGDRNLKLGKGEFECVRDYLAVIVERPKEDGYEGRVEFLAVVRFHSHAQLPFKIEQLPHVEHLRLCRHPQPINLVFCFFLLFFVLYSKFSFALSETIRWKRNTPLAPNRRALLTFLWLASTAK